MVLYKIQHILTVLYCTAKYRRVLCYIKDLTLLTLIFFFLLANPATERANQEAGTQQKRRSWRSTSYTVCIFVGVPFCIHQSTRQIITYTVEAVIARFPHVRITPQGISSQGRATWGTTMQFFEYQDQQRVRRLSQRTDRLHSLSILMSVRQEIRQEGATASLSTDTGWQRPIQPH